MISDEFRDQDPELWAKIELWIKDDNTFWAAPSGDHQNAIDLLYDAVLVLQKQLERTEEEKAEYLEDAILADRALRDELAQDERE